MKRWIDFSKHISLRTGGKIEVEILSSPRENLDGFLIGGGNNLLVSPKASNLFMLGDEFDYIRDLGDLIEVGGKVNSGQIYHFFKKNDLGGLEFLRGLPGTLGGLVKMNAGMKEYEIKQTLHSVWVDGEWRNASDFPFSYRNSGISGVIYAARFHKVLGFRHELIELFDSMRKKHPRLPSCGSCFKNPKDDFAGRILESLQFRGMKIGGMGFSNEHANFLVNFGNGSFQDAIDLVSLAQKRAFDAYGISLEREVVIID